MVKVIYVLSLVLVFTACRGEKSIAEKNPTAQKISVLPATNEITENSDENIFVSFEKYSKQATRGLASKSSNDDSDAILKDYPEYSKPVPVKFFKGSGKGKDLFEIEVKAEGHPVGKGTEVKIFATCAPDFERQLITPEYFRICEYEGHSYNKDKDEIRLSYRVMAEVSCHAREIEKCEKEGKEKCIEKAVKKCEDADPCEVALTTVWPLCPEPTEE